MITDKEVINEARRRLQSYTTINKYTKQWESKIEELHTKINSVASGSPKKLPEGNSDDIDWRSPLFDDIEKYKKMIRANEMFIEPILKFVFKLDAGDRDIINRLYLIERKPTYKQVCKEFNYTREGLRDRVEWMILNYWEY